MKMYSVKGLGVVLAAAVMLPLAAIAADMGSGGMMGMKCEMKSGEMKCMASADAPEGLKARADLLMNVEIDAADPQAVLTMREQLMLTDDQAQKVNEILTEARNKTLQLLNEEQKNALKPLEGTPKSMATLHQQIAPTSMPAASEKGDVIYTCPMHPEIKQNSPGKCPKCGMNLVPEKSEGHQVH